MELLALIIINIAIAVVLYYVVSIKVMANVRDKDNRKMMKEMEEHITALFETSENYLNLLDSRIVIIKNLIARLEEKEKNLAALPLKKRGNEPAPLSISSEILRDELQKEEYSEIMAEGIETEYLKNEIHHAGEPPRPSSKTPVSHRPEKKSDTAQTASVIAAIGRGVKSLFGVKDIEIPDLNRKIPPVKTGSLDLTVSGNPLLDKKEVRDNKSQIDTFKEVFDSIQGAMPPKVKDHINISIKAALKEIPEEATKVDKVVTLLKKKFTAEEIADEMGLALPEVELIKTFRLGRSGF